MRESSFTDYLIEKPLTLVYWNVSQPFEGFTQSFEDTEIKKISSVEEVDYWLKVGEVRNILIATSDKDKIKEFRVFWDKLFPEKRREIFVILITDGVHTIDPVETFVYSVNLLININDLEYFSQLYRKSQKYWEQFYKNYKRVLAKVMEEI